MEVWWNGLYFIFMRNVYGRVYVVSVHRNENAQSFACTNRRMTSYEALTVYVYRCYLWFLWSSHTWSNRCNPKKKKDQEHKVCTWQICEFTSSGCMNGFSIATTCKPIKSLRVQWRSKYNKLLTHWMTRWNYLFVHAQQWANKNNARSDSNTDKQFNYRRINSMRTHYPRWGNAVWIISSLNVSAAHAVREMMRTCRFCTHLCFRPLSYYNGNLIIVDLRWIKYVWNYLKIFHRPNGEFLPIWMNR